MKSPGSDSWTRTLRELGVDLTLLSPEQYGHSYGERFFSMMEENLQTWADGMSTALGSPKLAVLSEKRPDILRGYEEQFKDWPAKVALARKAYQSSPTASELSETVRSCNKFLDLLDGIVAKDISCPIWDRKENWPAQQLS